MVSKNIGIVCDPHQMGYKDFTCQKVCASQHLNHTRVHFRPLEMKLHFIMLFQVKIGNLILVFHIEWSSYLA